MGFVIYLIRLGSDPRRIDQPEKKKLGNKIAKYRDFTLISPEKNLACFRGFNSTNHFKAIN